jgi:fibronectin-binding autotransporter adhesin
MGMTSPRRFTRRTLKRNARTLALACVLGCFTAASAQTYTWSGSSSDSNWNDPLNWVHEAAPISGFTDSLSFQSGNQRANDDNYAGTFELNTLAFAGTGWNLSGSDLGFASAGQINLDALASATITSNLIVADDGRGKSLNIVMNSGSSLTFNGQVSGSAGLNISGAGTLTVNDTNSYVGATSIDQATVNVTSFNGLGLDNALTMTGGTLNISGTSASIGSLVGTSSSMIELEDAVLEINGVASTTFAGAFVTTSAPSGDILYYRSSGTLTLSGDNSSALVDLYLAQGTVVLGSANSFTNQSLIMDGGILNQNGYAIGVNNLVFGDQTTTNFGSIENPGQITLSGSVFYYGSVFGQSEEAVISNPVVLTSGTHEVSNNGVAGIGPSVDVAFMDAISGSGGLFLTSPTSETRPLGVALYASNSFAGGIDIGSGTALFAETAGALPITASVGVETGGTLTLDADQSVGSLYGGGTVKLNGTQLITGNDNTDSTFSGQLAGSGTANAETGQIDKVGTGTLTLSGGSGEMDSLRLDGGSTVIDDYQLTLDSTTSDNQTAFLVGGASATIQDGAEVNLNANGHFLLNGLGATLLVTGENTVVNAGHELTAAYNGGTTGDITIDGGATVSATYAVFGGGGSGSGSVSGLGTSLTADQGIIANVSGATGRLTISDGGSVTVGAMLFGSGAASLVVDKGTLTVGGFETLLSSSDYAPIPITSPSGGYAIVIGGRDFSDLDLSLTDGADGIGSVEKIGGGVIYVNVSQSYTGSTDILDGGWALEGAKTQGGYHVEQSATLFADEGAILNLGSNAIKVDANATAQISDATVIGGYIQGPGMVDLATSFDGGSADLIGVTTRSSANLMVEGSGVQFHNLTNGGQITNVGAFTWDGGINLSSGTINFNATASIDDLESDGVMNVNAGAVVNNSESSLTLGAGSRTYVGTVSSPGGVIDLGGQTLELNAGLLVNNGTIQNGLVNINYGSTAKGSGNYAGGYSVNYGGTFVPGNSPGTVQSGSAIWNEGGSYDFQIDRADGTAGTNWGLNQVAGKLTIDGGSSPASIFTVDLDSLTSADTAGLLGDFNSKDSYTWTFLTTTNGIAGFSSSDFVLDLSGFANRYDGTFSLELADAGHDLDLHYQAVPTPSTLSALSLGLLALLSRRPKKKLRSRKQA